MELDLCVFICYHGNNYQQLGYKINGHFSPEYMCTRISREFANHSETVTLAISVYTICQSAHSTEEFGMSMSELRICGENVHAQIHTALIQIKYPIQSSANSENLWVDRTLCKQPLIIFGLMN